MIEKILSLSSPLGNSFDLCRMSWSPGTSPEDTLSIVSGLHGDQLNGLYINSRLSRFLDDIVEGREPRFQLKGKVQIFPVINTGAVESGSRLWPFDGLDMDLTFPGNEWGEVTEKVAHTLLQHTTESSQALLLKTAPVHYRDAPHIQCFQPNRTAKKMARSLGLEKARKLEESTGLKLQLLYQWVRSEIPALIISAGSPGTIDGNFCEQIFQGIVNMFVKTGLLDHREEKGDKTQVHFYGSQAERKILTGYAGMFVSEVKVGDYLKQGQKVGEVRDIYSGKTLEQFLSPQDGFLVTLRHYPLVYEKETVAILVSQTRNQIWPF